MSEHAGSEIDAIEAINVDQLVTATDRLLLRASQHRRLAARRTFDLSREAALAVAASRFRAGRAAFVDERTIYVRDGGRRRLLGHAALIAFGTWLGVTAICLLA